MSCCARYKNSNILIADLSMDHSDSETEELSPEQMEVLVQLQEITGLEDMAVCRALLVSSNWDPERVVREQLAVTVTWGRHTGGPAACRSCGEIQHTWLAPLNHHDTQQNHTRRLQHRVVTGVLNFRNASSK